jgi:hypothetical protein
LSNSNKQIIGQGSFSEVRICKLKDITSDKAVKILRKKDLLVDYSFLYNKYITIPLHISSHSDFPGIA